MTSKNIKGVSTVDLSFKVQSFITIQQVNTPQREEFIYFYLCYGIPSHSSVTMIKTSPLFKLTFYAVVCHYNELFYNTHPSTESNLLYVIIMLSFALQDTSEFTVILQFSSSPMSHPNLNKMSHNLF